MINLRLGVKIHEEKNNFIVGCYTLDGSCFADISEGI